MTPLKLKLTGFAGIQSGRGKGEIELDFTAIDSTARIVALAGPNGAGKTTIMDNLHPYRVMPSRASSPLPTAFSYYEHIVGGEGSKELEWEHEAVLYRSVLRFRVTPKTKKQECYLFKLLDGQAIPWTDPQTGLCSDGKSDTYDRCIEAILGKPEVFFTAQFSAQGKQPIGRMTASEVKTLLGQMLGMEKIGALGAKAHAVIKELKPYLNAAMDAVLQLQKGRPDAQEVAQRRQQMQADEAQIVQAQAKVRQERDAALGRLSVAQQDYAQQDSIRAQHVAVQEQLDSANQALAQKLQALDAQQKSHALQLRQQVEQANSSVNVARQRVNDLQRQLTTQQELAAKAPQLAQTQKALEQLQPSREVELALIEQHGPAAARLDEIRMSLHRLQQGLARAASDGKHIAEAVRLARGTASLLGQVPCQGTPMSRECKLLAQAHAAATELPAMEDRVVEARRVYKLDLNTIDEQQKQVNVLIEADSQLKEARKRLEQIDTAIGQCKERLAHQAFVEAAVKQLPALREQLALAHADLERATAQWEQAQRHVQQQQESVPLERQKVQSESAKEFKRLEAHKANLPALTNGTDLQQAQQMVQNLEGQEKQLQDQAQEVAKARSQLDAQAAHALETEAQLVDAQKRVDALSAEISEWVLLDKALSTDGIIAMQIDDAGPAIAAIANTLLEDCYGGRFQITLVTQAKTAAGIQKEAFLIQVEDAYRGESKLLELMSGGEKVWINECLVRAIALHIAQTADKRYDTLFCDESDGALDPERKRQYMQMKRAVLERGGYSREYLITQTPELLHLCDAVIDVAAL